MTFETWLQSLHPQIPSASAQAVLQLSGEGGTVPFIARYRKEATGNLDEQAIQLILQANENWQEVIKRKAFILKEIEAQQKLTPELKAKIEKTFDLPQLEDLYLPYKQKKKTKAQKARDAGLEPLALWIWRLAHGEEKTSKTLGDEAAAYVGKVKSLEEALAGAGDILTEKLAEMLELRQHVREKMFKEGKVRSAKGGDYKENSKFSDYVSYDEAIASLLKPANSHRYLAVRRGWNEKELTVTMGGDEAFHQALMQAFQKSAWSVVTFPGKDLLAQACERALNDYVLPSIENEVHKALKDQADTAAIQVFAENVRKLLLAAPFGAQAVLGIDPGIRTGCKVAVVDDSGKYLASTVFHFQSEREREQAKNMLVEVIGNGNVKIKAIAVGNGTHGRETEAFVRAVIKDKGFTVPVVLVSEAGASVYSASDIAREEFPDLDLTIRGAISIARRLQDPLAELVKVDPKSIGVGQYQHDVSQPLLKKSLEQVVDSCVNAVGVNLNTASEYLLGHVSGIGPAVAKNLVRRRVTKGLFRGRHELLEIPRFSQKIFEQAAGFLRVPGGESPLDNTGIHPERYEVLEKYAQRLQKKVTDLIGANVAALRQASDLKNELGAFTFNDILQELEKPGRDPRQAFIAFQFREDVHGIEDLQPEMRCPGIVTNVTNFGAFVDIGVHQDGLVHVSELADRFVKDPREIVSPGDQVQVRVLDVDAARKRIALSLKTASKEGKVSPERRRDAPPPKQKPQEADPNSPFAALAKLKLRSK